EGRMRVGREGKGKRKTTGGVAASAGEGGGTTISRNRLHGLAPSVAGASDRRGSSVAQNVPTTRTTTATLKNACATRIGAHPRWIGAGRIAMNASATTTVGSTNGTTTTALTRPRPRKR